ncbi:MAG: methylmalonyl Co-A mutase-associated GTPase MeaB [Bacteroidetes bacterium]|nr:methylmalonyl Co-A mutase-associated GTPase MeaB [Bacteroidota bacterium]
MSISIDDLKSGNRRTLSKAITLIESTRAEDRESAQKLLQDAMPFTGGAWRIGVSGVPGVGKSTFIESLGMLLIARGLKVAVLAVDPSSPFSGGSILGDKTRMEKLVAHEDAFIRPSPTAGSLGGVTQRTRESILLCEAAGYDVILIETVGVGQSEYEVASMSDLFLLLMLPGAGDALQGIKRGILELANVMVVNKCDGDNRDRAEAARREIEQGLHYLQSREETVETRVFLCSALTNEGIEAVWDHTLKQLEELKSSKRLDSNRRKQNLNWVKSLVEQQVLHRFWNDGNVQADYMKAITELRSGSITPMQAVDDILKNSP